MKFKMTDDMFANTVPLPEFTLKRTPKYNVGDLLKYQLFDLEWVPVIILEVYLHEDFDGVSYFVFCHKTKFQTQRISEEFLVPYETQEENEQSFNSNAAVKL